MKRVNRLNWLWSIVFFAGWMGCSSMETRPVDIHPEDACAQCRMAISEKQFASEIITGEGEILKFDDLGCLESYRKNNPGTVVRRAFATDYNSKNWIPYEKSVIVRTGITTPMGSGKIAFSDSTKAALFAQENPSKTLSESGESCGGGCCGSKRE